MPVVTGTIQEQAAKKMSRARARLLLDAPWFGSLALRLKMQADENLTQHDGETPCLAATDGTRVLYRPDQVVLEDDATLVGLQAHEVLHCALLHPYRFGARDLPLWNQACDYVINLMLSKNNFKLPKGGLLDAQYDGMSAEQVYAKLVQNKQDGGGGQGQGQQKTMMIPAPKQGQQSQNGQGQGGSQPGQQPSGGNQPQQPQTPPQPQAPQMSEVDWQIAAQQATNTALKAGTMPADVERNVKTARETKTDWRTLLKRFVEQTVATDYSWSNPNRRFVHMGVYLPGSIKENVGKIYIGVDTSGSIQQRQLDIFAEEVRSIVAEVQPREIEVIYCDTKVARTEIYTPEDEIEMAPFGGGGTYFKPVFDHIDERTEETGESPLCAIYFTDLENGDRGQMDAPDYPVIWVTHEGNYQTHEFGERVEIDLDGEGD